MIRKLDRLLAAERRALGFTALGAHEGVGFAAEVRAFDQSALTAQGDILALGDLAAARGAFVQPALVALDRVGLATGVSALNLPTSAAE